MKRLLLWLIRFYQRRISPAFPRRCRFEPTCSEYARQAIGRYGAIRGGALAARRVCRCQPWSKRGYYDPVTELPPRRALRMRSGTPGFPEN